MRSRRHLTFKHFLILSLLIHAGLMLSAWITALLNEKPIRQTVQLEIVTPPASEPPALTTAENRKPVKKKVEDIRNQVVDQEERALNDEKPDDSHFLSRNNQVVKRQTVARNRGEFKNQQTKETESGEHGKTKTLSKLNLAPKFDVAKAVQDRIERENAFDKAARDGLLPVPEKRKDLQVSTGSQEQAGGKPKGGEASQTLDYIKDLDPGLETLLSTKEFVYYSYFNRIRNQLNQYWTDKVRQKISEMYKKGRSIASSDDKITKCLITLDTTGRILRIQVIGDSGVHELDEAAVEAFRAAAPFPNPPKGMVDSDGTIKIRWDFILEA